MMRVKDGVNIYGMSPQIRYALKAANSVWMNHGRELVVTSCLDGDHSPWSWHYCGQAVDLRTRYWSPAEIQLVADDLAAALRAKDGRYQVIVEPTHIHVEWDNGENW